MGATSTICNEDPSLFKDLGYCVFRNGVAREEIDRYSAALEKRMAEGTWEGEPHVYFKDWRILCCHPRILDAIEVILGPALILFYSSTFVKQPKDDKRVDWHQDNTYWTSVHGTDVVTAWLALDHVDEESACMKVIPGSHRNYRELPTSEVENLDKAMLRKKVAVSPELEQTAVSLVMAKGEISVHDSFLIHGSDENKSDRRRAGYTIRYGNALTTTIDLGQHTHSDHPTLPVYYVRGSGENLRAGYEDLRPEATARIEPKPG